MNDWMKVTVLLDKHMRVFHLETLHFGEIHNLRYIILKPTVQITALFWPFGFDY